MIGLLLTVAGVGYAVVAEGGIRPVESNIALSLLGAAGVLSAALANPLQTSGTRQSLALLAAMSLLAYVALQVFPLPLVVLELLDPARTEISAALSGVMARQRFATLSILPAETYVYLSRMAGYVLVFLAIRASAQRFSEHPWIAAIPLMALGGLESFIGFRQRSNAAAIQGTFASSNHFAGLLEMVLPLVLMYGIAMMFRGRERGVFQSWSLIKATPLFVVAFGVFVAIVLSGSVMGVLSALGSLFVMAFIGWAVWLTGARRASAVAGLVLVAALLAYSVPTQELASEFGDLVVNRTTSGRAPIARDTLSIVAAYPLFGSGLGTYFPALLRYQTSLLDYAVLNAHNDYLQLLSELGAIGFLILAVLIGSVWIQAALAAVRSADREVRLLALGCAGGLTAILIHSIGDFNMYVPANAMVLAWIAGISASLPEHNKRTGSISTSLAGVPRISPRFMRAFVFVVGFSLSVYAGAWLTFLHGYQSDPRVEETFCQFGICDSNGVRLALERRHDGDLAAAPPAAFHELLLRDPAGPYNWMDLGASLHRAGRTAEAREAFARALQLGPNIPYMLVRAGRFHFDLGERDRAFDLMSRALQGNPAFGRLVFSTYDEKVEVADVVRRGLPPVPAAWGSYLEWKINQQRVEESSFIWTELIHRGYATDRLANQVVRFLNEQKDPAAAVHAWSAYAGGVVLGYPDPERVFNGDFELETRESLFDWRMTKSPGAVVDVDSNVGHSGSRALRIAFDGTANSTSLGVGQLVYLDRGRYRLSAYVRTDGVSTDEGVRFTVTGEGKPSQLAVTTGDLRGTNDWTLIEQDFDAPGGIARLSVVRNRSFRFDRLIKGTAWVDQVSIRPIPAG